MNECTVEIADDKHITFIISCNRKETPTCIQVKIMIPPRTGTWQIKCCSYIIKAFENCKKKRITFTSLLTLQPGRLQYSQANGADLIWTLTAREALGVVFRTRYFNRERNVTRSTAAFGLISPSDNKHDATRPMSRRHRQLKVLRSVRGGLQTDEIASQWRAATIEMFYSELRNWVKI